MSINRSKAVMKLTSSSGNEVNFLKRNGGSWTVSQATVLDMTMTFSFTV
jgi:hypothetical protein